MDVGSVAIKTPGCLTAAVNARPFWHRINLRQADVLDLSSRRINTLQANAVVEHQIEHQVVMNFDTEGFPAFAIQALPSQSKAMLRG
jgi:hypothetical protein